MMQSTSVFFIVVSLLWIAESQQESSELFLQNYEAALIKSGIPFNETLVFDISSLESPVLHAPNCEPLPDSFVKVPPTSVHALSPNHIKVVGAVGDSVTAGFGAKAKCLFQAMTEYRGVSWSIGGDPNVQTIPNILKLFSPDVKGFSVKTGKATSKNAHFNRAVSGAVASQIPSEVQELVNMIKSDQSVDVQEDWKIITLWIGGNDLCQYCHDTTGKSAENYVKFITEGLDIIRNELPRTFVNLVQILDVTKLGDLKTNLLCDIVHLTVCPCVAHEKYWSSTSQASVDYNTLLEETIANTPNYHDSDEFAVVLQPFFKKTELPRDANGNGDASYFGFDCFHFTAKGHAEIAGALWNNMMEPVGRKDNQIQWGVETNLRCPTINSPYFYTSKNSLLFSNGMGDTDQNSNGDDQSSVNLLAVLLGTGLAAVILVVAIAVVVVALVYKRHRQGVRNVTVSVGVSMDTEKTRLIFQQ